MSCSTIIKNESYDFFDNINEYIKHLNESVQDNAQLHADDNCNSFSEAYGKGNKSVWRNICEQFIKLCKQLPRVKNKDEYSQNYMKDWNFLSYWLNSKLRENKLNGIICPNDFYKRMEDHCFETLSRFVSSTNLIYNIKKEDLSRMELLYILHDNYSKLNDILKDSALQEPKSILTPSSTCFDNYKIARYMCEDKYKKFCEKLEMFKTEYDKLHIAAKSKGDQFASNLKELTDYDNSNIISTTIIGSAVGLIPLLGILYKFTPIGQMIKSPKNKLPKGHSNNIDEIIKTSLQDYENEHLNFKQEKYNIEYHPARIR